MLNTNKRDSRTITQYIFNTYFIFVLKKTKNKYNIKEIY